MTLTVEAVERAVRDRLSSTRLDHVVSVARTVDGIAGRGGWSESDRRAALRAAWLHDAVKDEAPGEWRRRIRAGGEEPDPWAASRAPILLHAQAAAVWARERGETDPRVVLAVRHHPTGHPGWGSIGRALYVADFCEPGRAFAADVDAAGLRRRAGESPAGLVEAAATVLRLRLAWHLDRGRPIHPLGLDTWNAWSFPGEA